MPRGPVRAVAAMLVVLGGGMAAAQSSTPAWQALDAQVTELYGKGDLPRAIEVAEAAVRLASTPAETGRSLDRLGFLYYTSGDLAKGERLLRDSLRTREAAFGGESLEAAETANDLAMLLRDLRRMDEAKSLATRAVTVRERALGPHALPLAESLDTLGTVYGLSGEYGLAVTQFERALAIHDERPADQRASEEYGTLCVNLAGTYQRLGKYGQAEATFAKGLDALRIRPGVAHPAFAASELAYAALEVDLGQYAEAERLYDEGGRLVERELGREHPVYATFLNNRGFFFQSIGNAAAAEADYRQSLDLKRRLYGPDSLLAASTLRNLAHLTYALDRPKGERLLTEAVDTYARLANAPPFDYVSVLVGLARAQRERGAVDVARATATRAFDLAGQRLGNHHPLFASAARELGLARAAAGDASEGERLLRMALGTAEQVHGPSHPDVAPFLDALGDARAARGDAIEAEALYARSLGIQERFLADVLAIGSENFKAATLAASSDPVPRLIAFAESSQLAAARTLAFEAVTRRKGRIVEQLRERQQWLDEHAAAPVRRRIEEWRAVVACRTSLTVALGYRDLKPAVVGSCSLEGTDLQGRYEKLLGDLRARWTPELGAEAVAAAGVLQQRADALETALNREAGAWIDAAPHVTSTQVRTHLRDDEALLEFVSYRRAAEPSEDSRRYGAFVLSARGPIGWADLGAAAAIDATVRDLSDAARDWSISSAHHETEAARASKRTAEDALATLSKRVWQPLKPLIGATVTQLRIAPDALLNLLPFEALADGSGALIDRFAIAYLPAGRDLADTGAPAPAGVPVVVVSTGPTPRARPAAAAAAATFRADQLVPLSAAVEEADDVRRLVPAARLYEGHAASEQRVKTLHAPALLHIVGHGVVRSGGTTLTATAQAMTLAAVVLDEAYDRRAGPEDGLLTALELQNVDLRGTEMLVLSQCQMASGLPSVGEGVYGMRRAAAVAGARSFVAPLWNVEDTVQRRLMKRFYERLAAGGTRAEALRRAKLSVRRTAATASFLYWAPVILSGSAGAVPASLFGR